MLDSDLAELYQVDTKRLNEQVKRNSERFPEDFMFQLQQHEWNDLKPQIATSSSGSHGGRRTLPYVFTEHGVLMLSSVLNSKSAITVNIQIMRVYTKMRELLQQSIELNERMESMEERLFEHDLQILRIVKRLETGDQGSNERPKIGYKS